MPATHLRHGIYAEVIAGEVGGAIAVGELSGPVGDATTVSAVLRSDLAAGIATVLLKDGHEGKTYEFTGPDAVSWNDLAAWPPSVAASRSPSLDRRR